MLRELALWFGGLLVVLWALRDFSRGFSRSEIRYATQYDRYFLGLFFYAIASLLTYFVSAAMLLALYGLIYTLLKNTWLTASWLDPLSAAPWSLVAAMIVTTVLPELPWVRQWTDWVRDFARALALYPRAFLRLTKLLDGGRFTPDENVHLALEQKLGRYGVHFVTLSRLLSPSTRDSLLEIQTLRDEFWRLQNSNQNRRLRDFLQVRQQDLGIVERNYQRIVRRTAQICNLDGAVQASEDQPYPLSDFVVHSIDRLLLRYRTLISQAALSCFRGGKPRRGFIQGFGYVAPHDWLLPYWPVFLIMVFDALLFLLPNILGDAPTIQPTLLALFLFGHALAQVFAVSWAILPKAVSNFARPSLQSLPWHSYFLFAAASYISGAFILLLFNYVAYVVLARSGKAPPLLLNINPFVVGALFAAYFPVITGCLSFLTDLHLRRAYQSSWYLRLLDGLASAAAMAATNVVVIRGIIYLISGHFLPNWPFFYIVTSIGAFVGTLVPASAATYLRALETKGEDTLGEMAESTK